MALFLLRSLQVARSIKKITIYLNDDDLETFEQISREELWRPPAQALLIIREELKRWRLLAVENRTNFGVKDD